MKFLLALFLLLIIGAGIFLLMSTKNLAPVTSKTTTSSSNTVTPSSEAVSPKVSQATQQSSVTYTKDGFSPSALTVKAGTKLTWVNQSSDQVAIGVDPHPIHTGDRSITNGEFTLNLNPGESKMVTLNKTGSFGYHNHLNPSQTGTITVE